MPVHLGEMTVHTTDKQALTGNGLIHLDAVEVHITSVDVHTPAVDVLSHLVNVHTTCVGVHICGVIVHTTWVMLRAYAVLAGFACGSMLDS